MATSASLLAQTEAAIEALLTALADPGVEEYQLNGRRVRRPQFGPTLDALIRARDNLRGSVARANHNPVRVVRLGRCQAVDR